MSGLREQYERILDGITRPGRYLGNERGAVAKDPKRVAVRFALAFPEVYEIAQSHPGLQILYDLLNRRPDVFAERVYAPWVDMEAALRRAGLPLVSLETFTPLSDFHIVGFSLQYELTYTNLLAMLDLGGIPLRASERTTRHPLVIAGGPCAFNPEPLADFLDAVLLGDGEEAVHDLCNAYRAWDGRDRNDLLTALAAIPGVYVPAFFAHDHHSDGRLRAIRATSGPGVVDKRILRDLDSVPIQQTFVIPSVQIVHDRPSLEVMRGCVKGCRFCQAGYIYRPLRERDPNRVLEQAETAIRRTGYDEVSLLSLSTGDYSCVNPLITEIMNRFASRKVAVSLPSTRVDALATPLLEQIKRVRKTGFTLAPEAGSQRMRDIIQKEYTEEELVNAARQIFALGWRSLKLYFMLGLPSETKDDLLGIAELSAKVAAAGGYKRQVTASVSNFVPKPHTPFQWAPQIPVEEIHARQQFLKAELTKRRVKFKWHHAEESYLEGIFSRGDRRLAPLLREAYERGCRFDGWSDQLRMDLWREAWSACGIDPDFYHRRRLLDEILPWDHLSSGVKKTFLQRELAYAFERTLTPDCSIERCTYCGACDFTSIRNVTYHLRGAKGSEHRGKSIDGWARATVPGDQPGAWEPRGWHLAEAKRAGLARPATAEPDSEPIASTGSSSRAAAGGDSSPEGSAQAWINAGSSALVPDMTEGSSSPTGRIRVRYAKLALARFLGHLELGSVFFRAARRIELPVAFSQGHHPLPRFSFGPALPLGTESDCEFLDVDLTAPVEVVATRAALNEQMPPGLEIIEVTEIPLRAPSIDSQILAFGYQIDGSLLGRPLAAAEPVAAFLASADFPVRKHSRTGARLVNARPFVQDLRCSGPERVEALIGFGPNGTLKPLDLMATILGLDADEASKLRARKVATHFRPDSNRFRHSAALAAAQ